MKFTGERFTEECQGDILYAHYHRYLLATSFVNNKVVLDIACGEGYGSYMLGKYASQVIGVDISEEAIQHAKSKYLHEKIKFLHGEATNIPLPDSSVDIIVSFETIEHLFDHEQMLKEFKRVLREDGLIVISSPDKKNYSDVHKYENEFHVKELYREEFEHLMKKHFRYIKMLGQSVVYGSLIMHDDKSLLNVYSQDGHDYTPVNPLQESMYLICIASDTAISTPANSLFTGHTHSSSAALDLNDQLTNIKESFLWKLQFNLKRIPKGILRRVKKYTEACR